MKQMKRHSTVKMEKHATRPTSYDSGSPLKMLSSICCVLASTDGELEPSSITKNTLLCSAVSPSKQISRSNVHSNAQLSNVNLSKTSPPNPVAGNNISAERSLEASSFHHLLTTNPDFKMPSSVDEAIEAVVGPFQPISSLSTQFPYSSFPVMKRFRGGPRELSLEESPSHSVDKAKFPLPSKKEPLFNSADKAMFSLPSKTRLGEPETTSPNKTKTPTKLLPFSSGGRCKDHARDGFVSITGRPCEGKDCARFPSFGYPGKPARRCATHKLAGMAEVVRWSCDVPECKKWPDYGFPGNVARLCKDHSQPGMVNVANGKTATTSTKKLPWTKEEDTRLTELVNQFGARKWNKIAPFLPGRNGKQCRERWVNQLNPELIKTKWTEEEDRAIIEAQLNTGNAWAGVARTLPGRTDNAVKNRWHSSIKNKLEQFIALHYGHSRFRQLWQDAPSCRAALLDKAVNFVRDRRRAKRKQAFAEAAAQAQAERHRQELLWQFPGVYPEQDQLAQHSLVKEEESSHSV